MAMRVNVVWFPENAISPRSQVGIFLKTIPVWMSQTMVQGGTDILNLGTEISRDRDVREGD